MKRVVATLVACVSLVACAPEPVFPMPMTAQAAVEYDSGDALVAYLAQPDATATVCDSHARGPHVDHLDADMREALVRGLVEGRVAPAKWLACATALLAHAPPDAGVVMLADVGRGYRSLVRDGSFEATPAMQERVAAMQKLYLERSSAIRDAHHELDPLFDDLRDAIAKRRLGPIARWYGTQLLGVVDLERGKWKGKHVDERVLDDVTADRDEETLRLFALRLPSAELREAARRRVVRLHVAASPFREVKADAMNVEDRVLIRGANPISTEQHAALKAWLD